MITNRYLHVFSGETDFNAAYNSDNYKEPWTSARKDNEKPHFNKELLETPLTFEILSAGTISWMCGSDGNSYRTIEYKKNNGDWTQITSTNGGRTISVSVGDKISFRGNNSSYAVNDSSAGNTKNSHFYGGVFNAYGNIMSLIEKDNFSDLKDLTEQSTFKYLFNQSGINDAKNLILPATGLTVRCYDGMFASSKLTCAPELPATKLAGSCYESMFANTSLTAAPELPATTLAGTCYSSMFHGCKSLTIAPELPATTLTNFCYRYMFQGCTSLTSAPSLPAENLTVYCYQYMFNGCTSLTTAPALPATKLAQYCYQGMFNGCTSLTTAPELPATTLESYCYQYMFQNCASLTSPPALPAAALKTYCYQHMFNGCVSITEAPELLANNLLIYSYSNMFSGCTNLNKIKCLATGNLTSTNLSDWVFNVSPTGTFYKHPNASWTTGTAGIPAGWTVETISLDDYYKEQPLTFSILTAGTITWNWEGGGEPRSIQYSINGAPWTQITSSVSNPPTLNVAVGDTVRLRGFNVNYCLEGDASSSFKGTAKFNLAGNIMSLIDGYNFKDLDKLTGDRAFAALFGGSGVVDASNLILPATALTLMCYNYMFNSCTSLTKPPKVLPAKTAKTYCYDHMFAYCTSMTSVPEIELETLAYSCCNGMFYNCSNITTAPVLKAVATQEGCYTDMFKGCSKLNHIECYLSDNGMKLDNVWTTVQDSDVSYPVSYTTSGGMTSVSNLTSCVGKSAEDPITGTGNAYASTSTANTHVDYAFSFENIPDGVSIDSVSVSVYGGAENTTFDTGHQCTIRVMAGNTIKLESHFSATSNSIMTLTGGTWTLEELRNAKIRCIVAHYGGRVGGITWNVNYSYEGYTYSSPNLLKWVDGVAVNGTFVKSEYATKWPIGKGGIPVGWTTTERQIEDMPTTLYIREPGYLKASNGTVTYNRNGEGWVTVTMSGENAYPITVIEGDVVELGPTTATFSGSTAYFDLYGNALSMAYEDWQDRTVLDKERAFYSRFRWTNVVNASAFTLGAETITGAYAAEQMFEDCHSLLSAPQLPATALSDGSYAAMFAFCHSLEKTPELPASQLAVWCYQNMFQVCTSLVDAGDELPATTLADYCYYAMFSQCSNLERAPMLPAEALVQGCYFSMFQRCSKLNYITCLATNTGASQCTTNWVYGVSSTGTFIKQPTASFTTGVDGIPSGWNVGDAKYAKPLTFSIISAGTIVWVNSGTSAPQKTIKYSKNGGAWTTITSDVYESAPKINVERGDTVRFKGDNISYGAASGCSTFSGSTAIFNVSENIMSLVDSKNYAANLSHAEDYAFKALFKRTNVVSASTLLLPQDGLYISAYDGLFSGCTRLKTAPELPATNLDSFCYRDMFNGCTGLTYAPALHATTLANDCYYQMFKGCTSLTAAPELPATTLATNCYRYMFQECTSLTTAPALPATTLASSCYNYMFYGCTGLTTAPALTATTLANECYCYMFMGCKSLTTAPALPATTLANSCYLGMFNGCTSLTTAPVLPATTLARYCYSHMFEGCTSLTTAPALPATALADYCYDSMFYGCTGLTTAPALTATTLVQYCYQSMFNRCTSLTTAPELPATTLANNCYYSMFRECTSLATAPALPAATLASYCYSYMFYGCKSLTTAPALPAVTLIQSCYSYMFAGCTSLTTAPALPATTLKDNCYQYMFNGCTSLTAAPALPATTLAQNCYYYMFYGCTSLKTAPALPATTLKYKCYSYMFYGCTSLTVAPELPATTLAQYCYQYMFRGCTGLTYAPRLNAKNIAYSYDYQYMFYGCSNIHYIKCLATGTTSTTYTSNWVGSVGSTGTFVKNSAMSNWTTGANGIPSGWNIKDEPSDYSQTYLTFDIYEGGTIVWKASSTAVTGYSIDYKINDGSWTTIASTTEGTSFNVSTGDRVQFRGNNSRYTNGSSNNYNTFSGSTAKFEALGNIMSLVYGDNFIGNTAMTGSFNFVSLFSYTNALYSDNLILPSTTLTDYCYYNMFYGCGMLKTAPVLHAITLALCCYYQMFFECASLTNAPALPATALTSDCYYGMFQNCYSLTSAPALPATALASNCYRNMLRGCTSLTTAPELPATTLAPYCYAYMFYGCTGLTAAPALPSTTLASYCYAYMFYNCKSLTTAPALPATTLVINCYRYMFYNCKSLTTAPELPAATLVTYCYYYMFYGCTSLKYIKCLATNITASSCLTNWVTNVASNGVFVKESSMTGWPTGNNGIPTGWSVGDDNSYLSFYITESGKINWKARNNVVSDYSIEYKINNGSWTTISSTTGGTSFNVSNGDIVQLKGNRASYANSTDNFNTFSGSTAKFYAYGNVMSLLYGDNFAGQTALSSSCTFYSLFSYCDLLSTPSLPATTLTNYCYSFMFRGCKSLKIATKLPASTLKYCCYENMFHECTSLTDAPTLPATTLAEYCYYWMFQGCTSLATAPELPSTTLASKCYTYMFNGCTSLTSAPALPATALTSYCYQHMFEGCTSLTTAPALPATILTDSCYQNMFAECTSLTTAPALPAASLANYCCQYMFAGCTSLTTAPALPTTDLAQTQYCYQGMFQNCKSLTTAPSLPATTLVTGCYSYMFNGCTSLNYIKCLATNITTSNCLSNWVNGVSSTGTFVKASSMSSWPTGANGIPNGWTVQNG